MASIIALGAQVVSVVRQAVTSSKPEAPQSQLSDTTTLETNSKKYYLGYRTDDHNTPWGKHFKPIDTPLTASFIDGCKKSPVAAELGVPITKAPALLEQPGYLPLENGWTRLQDGTMYICALSDLPNVTGDMLDFWFYWHTNCASKYKLWNPDAHRYAWLEREKLTEEEMRKKSFRERYWDTTSFVNEYIGSTEGKLSIGFFDPRKFGFRLETPDSGIQTVVTAFVEPGRYTQIHPHKRADAGPGGASQAFKITIMHQLRKKPDGTGFEMRSRFWVGSLLAAGMKVIGSDPDQFGHDLAVHCHVEMTHLGKILPAIYEEFKDDIC
ncbi:hypothetical protein BP5796_00903 [Coleophoma crateriformis]|uniref:DAPG hydrolase PhiG domain-containing protein n=1 Tax=Coleophoma crateriformis TaxID=565419 RepID=A0A3D8T9A1_9HELO|nr:hypothetical protein BP5796_00903 [Coleophoma crateriformis]